jgi:hypothetical protein
LTIIPGLKKTFRPKREIRHLKVEQLDGPVLDEVRDGLDEELDEEVDGQHGRLPREVVVEDFAVELEPESKTKRSLVMGCFHNRTSEKLLCNI